VAVAQPAGLRSRRRHSADRFGSRESGVRHRKPPQVRAPAEDRIVQGPWRAGRGAESGDSAKNSSGHLCRAGQDRGSRLATALRVPPLAGSRCPGVASTCDPRSARRWVMAGVRPIPAAGRQRKPGADRSRTAGPFVLDRGQGRGIASLVGREQAAIQGVDVSHASSPLPGLPTDVFRRGIRAPGRTALTAAAGRGGPGERRGPAHRAGLGRAGRPAGPGPGPEWWCVLSPRPPFSRRSRSSLGRPAAGAGSGTISHLHSGPRAGRLRRQRATAREAGYGDNPGRSQRGG
jgi:hypothetical protein